MTTGLGTGLDRIYKIHEIWSRCGWTKLQTSTQKEAMIDDELTEKIIACAFKVHNALGPGFSEKVYEKFNASRIEPNHEGIKVKRQVAIQVYFEGEVVGEFVPDLWVEDRVLIELKAVLSLYKEHEVQLVNYLTATKVDIGLLINFGPSVEIKRKFRTYKAKMKAAGCD